MAPEQDSENKAAAASASEDTMDRSGTPPENSSDGERERTTREKLKKTSIAGLSQHSRAGPNATTADETHAESAASDVHAENGGGRGRPSKKRSFEELAKQEPNSPAENGTIDSKRAGHKRMRSREVPHDADAAAEYHQTGEAQEESDEDAQKTPGGAGVIVDSQVQSDLNAQSVPTIEDKILTDDHTTTTGVSAAEQDSKQASVPEPSSGEGIKSTLSPGSGFANTSSTSPFGAKSPPPSTTDGKSPTATSASAFASSGLSAFASQDKSPFGVAASTQSTGGFGGGAKGFGGSGSGFSGGFGGGAPVSGFGAAPSPFAASHKPGGSSFGSTAIGGFGGAGKGFLGGEPPKPFGGGPARFGGGKTKDGEEEGERSDAEGDEAQEHESDNEKQDSRFHQQDVETGEEDEDTIFNARVKLYHFEKEWKEKGTGVLKVNVRQEVRSEPPSTEADVEAGDMASTELKARIIMRADGVHRVILNSPVFKEMKVGTQDGEPPTGKTMFLTGMEDGNPRLFQIKMGKEEALKELYYRITEFKDAL